MVSGKSDELKSFIDYSISKGISKEQVQKMLLESGWPGELIDKIFAKPQKNGKVLLSAGKNALKVAGVSKSFGSNLVLNDITLEIKPGEVFGIIGLSGSGKTTLLNTIVGFVEPDKGDIVIRSGKEGSDYLVSQQSMLVKELFGFAAQHPSFYDMLTVEENLHHFASLYELPKKERNERCEYLLRMVELHKSKRVLGKNLSGGMQKRLDIACSLVHKPKVLILDEPTSDLDPVSREEMWDLIKEINAAGTTIILASHFVNELEELCSRFAILHNSKIAVIGTPEELKTAYSKNYEIILETKSRRYEEIIKELKSKKNLQVQKAEVKNRILTVYTQKPEQSLYCIARMIDSMDEKIIDIMVNRPTIKELFESVVKK